MSKNVGKFDSMIRIVIGIVLVALALGGVVEGTMATIVWVVAVILLSTSVLNFCPAYRLLGINTCPTR